MHPSNRLHSIEIQAHCQRNGALNVSKDAKEQDSWRPCEKTFTDIIPSQHQTKIPDDFQFTIVIDVTSNMNAREIASPVLNCQAMTYPHRDRDSSTALSIHKKESPLRSKRLCARLSHAQSHRALSPSPIRNRATRTPRTAHTSCLSKS